MFNTRYPTKKSIPLHKALNNLQSPRIGNVRLPMEMQDILIYAPSFASVSSTKDENIPRERRYINANVEDLMTQYETEILDYVKKNESGFFNGKKFNQFLKNMKKMIELHQSNRPYLAEKNNILDYLSFHKATADTMINARNAFYWLLELYDKNAQILKEYDKLNHIHLDKNYDIINATCAITQENIEDLKCPITFIGNQPNNLTSARDMDSGQIRNSLRKVYVFEYVDLLKYYNTEVEKQKQKELADKDKISPNFVPQVHLVGADRGSTIPSPKTWLKCHKAYQDKIKQAPTASTSRS